ncbi:DUF427 domain-containing protein [bacterium]|nr:DUF427 domain-containing protein [bacterium]
MKINQWAGIAFMLAVAINVFAADQKATKQESVWDYPRPPKVETTTKKVQVVFNDTVIAETTHAVRVLQTGHPPVYYIPREDVQMKYLNATSKNSTCEFKGTSYYYDVKVGSKSVTAAVWSYPEPTKGYEAIKDYLAFYPRMMDACYVDGERVTPEPGEYFGGWVTSDIVGPFEGQPKNSQ